MDMEKSTNRIQECLEKLALFTATPGEGVTRLPFTKEARQAVEYLRTTMEHSGLHTHEDEAGNIIGRLDGKEPQAPAVVFASHFDSVKFGGNFDGIAGVVVGLEIVRLLRENGVTLKVPIEVIGTNDEEGMRYGTGYFGVRAMAGEIDEAYLRRFKDADGVSIYDSMLSYGLDPAKIGAAKREIGKEIAAFIETHIEQGPVLENNRKEIGLVECIVGMQRFQITVGGRPDHAGTTPMDMRVDAMDCAAKVIAKIGDWAVLEGGGTVATVGFITAFPNAINVIAQEVQFSLDVRSRDEASIERIVAKVKAELSEQCAVKNATYRIEEKLRVSPVKLNEEWLEQFAQSCQVCGYSYQRIYSGAGHDSLFMAPLVNTAMIFVPSKDGRSHCPVEWTDYSSLAQAAHVLYHAMITRYGE